MTAAERTALTDVLQTASAGPSPPPIRRLRAAAEYVIRETEGEQIILFGSAGRGEFGKHSDFDFFVLKRGHGPGRKARGFSRLTHPDTGDRIDVLFEEPDRIPTARWNAGTVEYRHEIDRLAAAVAAIGETVPLPEDPDAGLLREISDYGKGGRYDRDQRTADPEGLFKAFRPIAGGIAGYARSRVTAVPQIVK